jgi:hypothetical protein
MIPLLLELRKEIRSGFRRFLLFRAKQPLAWTIDGPVI